MWILAIEDAPRYFTVLPDTELNSCLRYIKLQNGLHALLISDINNVEEEFAEEESSAESEIETDDNNDSGTDREDDRENSDNNDSGTDSEDDRENSDNKDEEKVKPEESPSDSDMEVEGLAVEEAWTEPTGKKEDDESTEKMSAAALCVTVGSFCDPEDLPGLAHFLEHMVFLGSSKYPDENGFDVFLKKHGGSENASTDCERTVFYFDIRQQYFKAALDRWAQFFIHPLMIRDAIDREVEAIDNEYQLAKPCDTNRWELLLGSLARPGYPMRKFFWGNAETLKHKPKKSNIDIYTRLKDFWQNYYSAPYMNLVVQSKETLNTLENWVTEIFSQIPNNGLPKPSFDHLTDPFDTPEFHKLYRVVPVSNIHLLNITWALPPQERNYRVKPLRYISWLVGHEGKGSILSFLRKKLWAVALSGGNAETGFEQNSIYSIFMISITLTSEGYEHFYEVAHVVFQYMKMLQKVGPDKRIWKEIQKINDNEFSFQDQVDPITYVENICENMHLFCKQDFLTGNQLLFDYKPEVIANVLDLLCPQRANLCLLSTNNEGKCPLKERWFETQYSVEDIEQYWAAVWAFDFEINLDLHHPEENEYLATDFSLKAPDFPEVDYPVKVLNTPQGCMWYKKDNKFRKPKVYVHFHLISPQVQQSAESVVLLDIFVSILSLNLSEPAYGADTAKLEYKLVAGEHGLIIRVKGFNHKLPLLLQLVVDHLSDFSFTSGVFEMVKEELKKTYFNMLIKSEVLAKDLCHVILEHGKWPIIDKYQRLLKGISAESLSSFVKAFKSQLFVEGLAQGNLTCQEAKGFLRCVVAKLQFAPLAHPCPVQFRVVDLPNTHLLCKVKTLNKGDANSEVTVYYQAGARSLRECVLTELLVMHMEEPCFNFLRTKETLGYHVYPAYRNNSGIIGFSISVTTQATKHNSEFVDKKIEEFLLYFEEKMKLLTEDAFHAQVCSLINAKECEDTFLGGEMDRHWKEIISQQYLFDRLACEIEALKSLTKEDLIEWFQVLRGKDRRTLSIHVVGYGEQEQDSEFAAVLGVQGPLLGEHPQLMFLPPSSYMKNTAFIRHIKDFTSTLNLLPYHKILQ
ncbi:nardilysin isoform X4 [Anas platyrhynchos]|uniref:nardilysin isoform X4 n=1 Tax=Anas platyrhynchos TaxID=8839 RepID=UPI003AF2E452